MNPAVALLAALAATILAVLILWPVRGWLWRGLRALRATERVLIEDALKHLFDSEYNERVANLQSLSGVLAVSGNRAAELLGRLQAQELVSQEEGGGYRLTPEGRRYALRIVRIHRLWESYLSDETGLDPESWHSEAERLTRHRWKRPRRCRRRWDIRDTTRTAIRSRLLPVRSRRR